MCPSTYLSPTHSSSPSIHIYLYSSIQPSSIHPSVSLSVLHLLLCLSSIWASTLHHSSTHSSFLPPSIHILFPHAPIHPGSSQPTIAIKHPCLLHPPFTQQPALLKSSSYPTLKRADHGVWPASISPKDTCIRRQGGWEVCCSGKTPRR